VRMILSPPSSASPLWWNTSLLARRYRCRICHHARFGGVDQSLPVTCVAAFQDSADCIHHRLSCRTIWQMQFGYSGRLLVRHDCLSVVSMLGVAGFAAAADYSYFVVDRRLHRCLFKLKEKEPCCYASSPS
jgi:hypothetical protein